MRDEIAIWRTITNIDNGDVHVELTFPKLDGTRGTLRVARSTLGDPRKLTKELLDKGAILGGLDLSRLLEMPAGQTQSVTGKAGWIGDTFVLPNATIGESQVVFDADALVSSPSRVGCRSGSLESWTKALRPALRKSSYLTMFTALAFGAPLAARFGVEETAVFHLHGDSGAGKTLLTKLVASVSGRASEQDLASFNVTPAAIDDILARGNGTLIPFNEMKLADTASSAVRSGLSAFGHTVTSGLGRVRSDYAKRNPDLAQRTWKAFAITNGESSLEERFKGSRDNGERARFIDLPVPRRDRGGIFDRFASFQDVAAGSARLASKVEQAIASNYGSAFGSFIEHVVKDTKAVETRFHAHVAEFIDHVESEDAWETRFACKFAYAYAGGMEAVMAGTMPTTRDLLRRSCITLCRLARDQIVTDQQRANKALLRLADIDSTSTRFPTIERGTAAPPNYDTQCWGMQRTMPGNGKCLGIPSARLTSWAGTPGAFAILIDRLKAGGAHVRGEDKAGLTTIVEMMGVKKRRYILLKPAAVRALALDSVP